MTPEQFSERAEAFAAEVETLLGDCYEQPARMIAPFFNGETFRGSFRLTVELGSQKNRQQVGELDATFRLSLDRSREHVSVEKSSFSVKAVRGEKDRNPVVRFEFEREPRKVPASHMHVHSDMAGLAIILHTNGKTEKSLHQHKIHYPGGGRLYRVILEDVIQFSIDELGFVGKSGWYEATMRGGTVQAQPSSSGGAAKP